jgi:hypothetical protein
MKKTLIGVLMLVSTSTFAENICTKIFNDNTLNSIYEVKALGNQNGKNGFIFYDLIQGYEDSDDYMRLTMADAEMNIITDRNVLMRVEKGICVLNEMYAPGNIWYVKVVDKNNFELHTKKDYSGTYRQYSKTEI